MKRKLWLNAIILLDGICFLGHIITGVKSKSGYHIGLAIVFLIFVLVLSRNQE